MKKQKILVVDDSALNRELLSEMLSDDYKICEAQNGQEAVELLADHWREYRLVLLDINMPVMDGYEVLRYMKAHNWLETLPVIAISAETGENNIGLAGCGGHAVCFFSADPENQSDNGFLLGAEKQRKRRERKV